MLHRRRAIPLPDAVYRDVVGMLFSTTLPVLGLGVAFVCIGMVIASHWNDPAVGAITAAAALTTVLRIVTISSFQRKAATTTGVEEIRRWERRYAIGVYVFALLLAGLNVRVLVYHYPLLHMITVSLVFGFGAGLVSRIAFRPIICLTGLLLATVPTVIGLALHALRPADMPLHAELFAIEALLVGTIAALSIETVRHLHQSIVRSVTSKHDLTFLAKQDELTGLANRLLLRERFEASIAAVAQSEQRLALHFLDLDGFKAINDAHGHPTGDLVLQEVAKRLTAMVRTEDTVARLGGDEFVVIQASISQNSEAEMLARRIIKQLSAPYQINGARMQISVSVGIAMAPEQGMDLDRLAACADAALYRSKGGGKGQMHFCTPDEAKHALSAAA